MNLKELLGQSVLRITGEINAKVYDKFMREIQPLANEGGAITIILNSSGGDTNYATPIHDFIAALYKDGIDINTLATGECMSSAVSISMAVPRWKRGGAEHTRWLIHTSAYGTVRLQSQRPRQSTTKISSELGDAYSQQEAFIVKLLTNGTKLTEVQIRKLLETDTYFNSQKALNWGFIGYMV